MPSDQWYTPTLPKQKTTSVAEHEVLLSWDNDDEPEFFEVWWSNYGKQQYLAWRRNRTSPYKD